VTRGAGAGGLERAFVVLLVLAAPGCILVGYNLSDYGGTTDGGVAQDGPPPDAGADGPVDAPHPDGPQDAGHDSGDTGLPPPTDSSTDQPLDLGPPDTGVEASLEAGTPHTVFVTAGQYSLAAFNGLAAADAICIGVAASAGLPGTYAAWLSSDTVSAASRMTHGTGLYVLPDGTVVALDWDHLANANSMAPLLHAIDEDELGQQPFAGVDAGGICPGPTWVWTGTNPGGVSLPGQTCGNWTDGSTTAQGVAGQVGWANQFWTSACSGQICSGTASFYCIEQ